MHGSVLRLRHSADRLLNRCPGNILLDGGQDALKHSESVVGIELLFHRVDRPSTDPGAIVIEHLRQRAERGRIATRAQDGEGDRRQRLVRGVASDRR